MKEALTRPAYTEIDTLNMLAHCRSAGLGIDQAIKFFVAKTPVKELRALKDGEDHPDAKPDDDKPCERCPYKPDDDAPESADKSAKATTSWDAAVSRVNANIAGGVTASAAPTGAGQ